MDHRTSAAERLVATALPTAELEEWRYSPIGDLDLDRYQPLLPGGEPPSGMPAGARAALDRFDAPAGAVVLCNGRIVHLELDPAIADQGVLLTPLASVEGGAASLGAVAGAAPDAFAEMNAAFAIDPILLRVPRGVRLERPVVVVSWVQTAGVATFPRLVVEIGEDAAADVVDIQGGEDVDALTVPVTEVDVARAGRLGLVTVQERGPATWHLATTVARVGQEAHVRVTQAALGGRYARSRTDCRLEGRGASGDLLAVWFGAGDQTLDLRTFQHHLAPDTTSDLLFKGVVDDRSRSIYTGLIRVGPEARGTRAFQTNRNIKLSGDAWAESVPNLEIENNDVQCSHASTVGPIDEDQRFYLESRGVPPTVAERLVVAGFFDEVVDQVPVGEVATHLHEQVAARLERRER